MWRHAVILLFWSSAACAAQSLHLGEQKNDLPEIGVVASHVMSIDRELAVGDIYMRQMRAQAPIVTDPLLQEYIQDIGNKLVAQADNVKFPYLFSIIKSDEINAFAFFGGHIQIYTGLILLTQNESELASVLAHEITHVTQRHLARQIEDQQINSPFQIASLLGGILLAIANPEAGIAAVSLSSAAGRQASINYTRGNEQEADRIGMSILSKAGFDPRAMAQMFKLMLQTEHFKTKPLAILINHPVTENRIADARQRAHLYPALNVPTSLPFQLAKARILARYSEDKTNSLAILDQMVRSNDKVKQTAGQYGKALMLVDDGKIKQAQAIIGPLLKASPDNLYYIDTQTDIYSAEQRYQDALKLLEPQFHSLPHNSVINLNMVNVLYALHKYKQGIQILKDYLLLNPQDTLAYQMLIEGYQKNKNPLQMHQAKAEYFALLSIYPKAIDELQTAYNFASEQPLEKQRIRARIDQFRTALEKLKKL